MAQISPFRATYYNPKRYMDLRDVVAPPYDVIGDRERDALYRKDPHNVVRIILNRPEEHDEPGATYRRAARHLRDWLHAGVLMEDETQALYVYRQTFSSALDGSPTQRTGVFAALGLSPYSEGVVLPHEYTRPGAKADRLELMRAAHANTEPIMVLYEDDGLRLIGGLRAAASSQAPLLAAHVGDALHEVWDVRNRKAVADFILGMVDRRVWIADGHHRYETALMYRDEVGAAGRPIGGADRILVALIPFEDPGFVVLPTHRMVTGLSDAQVEGLADTMSTQFEVQPVANDEMLFDMLERLRSRDGAFVAVTRHRTWLMRLRDPQAMLEAAPDRSEAWRALDVAILQALVLDRLTETTPLAEVSYTRYPSEAITRARVGHVDAAFVVGRPSAADVRAVAAAGDRMPAKSTYFDPKLWSGLLMRRLDR